ncbi:hypothetical protein QE152_g39515 [Popillia japonica]|uniref:Zinc finger PHD-type domain-containing protein n=1 Tax=Popillia japonica TaxID=7064 RepID=A0AAW1HTQ3_POPJA
MDIAISGYRCTGIHPFNRNVFSDVDFISSDMTNVPENLSISEPSLSSSQLSESTPSTSSQTTGTDTEQQIPSSEQSIYQTRNDVSKKGKRLVSRRDVSKKTKKDENENLIPPGRPIEEETICPLCLHSHEEDWIQRGKCKAWVHKACANISELSHQYFCDYCTPIL